MKDKKVSWTAPLKHKGLIQLMICNGVHKNTMPRDKHGNSHCIDCGLEVNHKDL